MQFLLIVGTKIVSEGKIVASFGSQQELATYIVTSGCDEAITYM